MNFEELMKKLKSDASQVRDAELVREIYLKVDEIAKREDLTEGDVICVLMKLLSVIAVKSTPSKRRSIEHDIELVSGGLAIYMREMFNWGGKYD